MLYKRQWRFGFGGTIGGMVLLTASLAISPAAVADYLRLGPTLSRWIDMPGMSLTEMACWQGFWRLLLADRPLAYAQAAAVGSSLLTLIPLVRSIQNPLDTNSPRFAPQFAVLVLATILISPHLLYYDLTLLLIPMVLAACSRPENIGNRTNDIVWPWSTAILFAGATVSRFVAAETALSDDRPHDPDLHDRAGRIAAQTAVSFRAGVAQRAGSQPRAGRSSRVRRRWIVSIRAICAICRSLTLRAEKEEGQSRQQKDVPEV